MKIPLILGFSLLLYANVYGWRMTGLLGRDGAWFIGHSYRGAP